MIELETSIDKISVLQTEPVAVKIIEGASSSEAILSNIPFALAVVIVFIAAVSTYRSNLKLIRSQEKNASQAREAESKRKIAEFRHHWLQEVRETSTLLIRAMQMCQSRAIARNVTDGSINKTYNDKRTPSDAEMQKLQIQTDELFAAKADFQSTMQS